MQNSPPWLTSIPFHVLMTSCSHSLQLNFCWLTSLGKNARTMSSVWSYPFWHSICGSLLDPLFRCAPSLHHCAMSMCSMWECFDVKNSPSNMQSAVKRRADTVSHTFTTCRVSTHRHVRRPFAV